MGDKDLGLVLFFAVVVGIPCIGWMVSVIVMNWRKVRVSEQLAALKQTLAERGMSADEIERVVNAGVPPEDQMAKTPSKT